MLEKFEFLQKISNFQVNFKAVINLVQYQKATKYLSCHSKVGNVLTVFRKWEHVWALSDIILDFKYNKKCVDFTIMCFFSDMLSSTDMKFTFCYYSCNQCII